MKKFEGDPATISILSGINRIKSLPAILALIGALSGQISACVSTSVSVRQDSSGNGGQSSTEVEVENGEVTKCAKRGNGESVIEVNGKEIRCNE
ncbi:hypothetical protein ACFL21_05230 [Patescibacteria group bacterium]